MTEKDYQKRALAQIQGGQYHLKCLNTIYTDRTEYVPVEEAATRCDK